MLRLCTRRALSSVRFRVASAVPAHTTTGALQKVCSTSPRHLGSVSAAGHTAVNDPEYPCSDADTLPDGWSEVEDWNLAWFDGRDKIHVRVTATSDSTDWRGIGFYSREAYWLGAIRWNELLRGEKPAVWLHWVGKDPVEISNTLPHPDSNGCYTFTMGFTKREFVMHCNGELLGTRKNMLYQFNNIGRVWFADLEAVKGSFVIEGPHTDDSGYENYNDVPMFQRAADMWKMFRNTQKEHSQQQFPDQGWRSS